LGGAAVAAVAVHRPKGASERPVAFAGGTYSDMDRGQARRVDRWDLDRRSCRLVHRTPVLYSRNQSRTNIALSKENGKEGAGQLAELIYMILEGRRIVRGLGAARTTRRIASWPPWNRYHGRSIRDCCRVRCGVR